MGFAFRDLTIGRQSLRSDQRVRLIRMFVAGRATGLSAKEISTGLKLSLRTVQRKLENLVAMGQIARTTRATPNGSEVIYRSIPFEGGML